MANEQYSKSTDSTDSDDSDNPDQSYESSSLPKPSENIQNSVENPSNAGKVLVLTRSGASRGESEEDRELLENLEALDPCGEYDDVEFSNRVKNFLEKYEKEISKEACTPQDWKTAPSSSTSPAQTAGEPRTTGQIIKSTEFSDKNSGVARKSMVRFKDAPEEIESSSESPIIGKKPPECPCS